MEWSKIKNIMILILACVNVFLLALVAVQEVRAARYEEEARAGAVQALERNGIAFVPERLPRDLELEPLTVNRDREGEQAAAEALLGPVEREDTGGNVRVIFTAGAGSAEFSVDGSFRVAWDPGGRTAEQGGYERESEAVLELLGFAGTLLTAEEDGEALRLTYRQSWEGAPVFSCTATLTWRAGSLVRAEGRRLVGTAAPAETGGAPLTTATVLVRFLAEMKAGGHVCSRIEEMTPGYRVSGAARPVALTPVWRIATDTGAYYVDGRTGALSQAE